MIPVGLAVAFALAAPAPAGAQQDSFGAIAVGEDDRYPYFGLSSKAVTQAEADELALHWCRDRMARPDRRYIAEETCSIRFRFWNQCVAIVADADSFLTEDYLYGWAWASDELAAQDEARSRCREEGGTACVVQRSTCSPRADGAEPGYSAVSVDSAEPESAEPGGGSDTPYGTDLRPVGPAGMEFVWIPPGKFQMGSTSAEASRNEQPLTQVRISLGFWLGKYEVTQEEWEAVMGSNPARNAGCARCPVETVSWEDVQEFIAVLNEDAGADIYRLPTEAEWEYAARAGTVGDRYGDLDEIAWWSGNSGGSTHPVGQKTLNGFGLHDMLGNVWERVQDWDSGNYPGGTVTDPQGPGSGSGRMFRGGGYRDDAAEVRTPKRVSSGPGNRYAFLGFRLLRDSRYGIPPGTWGGAPPPPLYRPPETIKECLWGMSSYVTPRGGVVGYDVFYVNQCRDRTLRFRFTVSIYKKTDGTYLGSNRHERVTRENFWLCGDNRYGPACILSGVPYPGPQPIFGNLTHRIAINRQVCLPEDPCPWPPRP